MSHPCNSQVKFQLLNVFIREKKSRLDKVASQKTEVGFNSPISCLSLVPMSQIQIPQCVSQSPHVGVVPKLLSVRVRKKNHVKILSRVLYQVLGRFQVPKILPGSPVVPTSESEQSQDAWMDWVLVITAVIRREFSSSNGNWSHQGHDRAHMNLKVYCVQVRAPVMSEVHPLSPRMRPQTVLSYSHENTFKKK